MITGNTYIQIQSLYCTLEANIMLYSISLPLYSISLQFKNKNIYIKKGKLSTAQFTCGSKETFSMKIKGTDLSPLILSQ